MVQPHRGGPVPVQGGVEGACDVTCSRLPTLAVVTVEPRLQQQRAHQPHDALQGAVVCRGAGERLQAVVDRLEQEGALGGGGMLAGHRQRLQRRPAHVAEGARQVLRQAKPHVVQASNQGVVLRHTGQGEHARSNAVATCPQAAQPLSQGGQPGGLRPTCRMAVCQLQPQAEASRRVELLAPQRPLPRRHLRHIALHNGARHAVSLVHVERQRLAPLLVRRHERRQQPQGKQALRILAGSQQLGNVSTGRVRRHHGCPVGSRAPDQDLQQIDVGGCERAAALPCVRYDYQMVHQPP